MSTFNIKTYTDPKNDGNDAFSQPIVRRRFQATQSQEVTAPTDDSLLPSVSEDSQSPGKVFSPPLSLPETLSDGNGEAHLSGSDDSEPDFGSQSSTASLNSKLESSSISQSIRSTTSSTTVTTTTTTTKKKSRAYDFDEVEDDEMTGSQPVQKKLKETAEPADGGAKFMPKKDKKLVYNHKWTTDDLEDEEEAEKPIASSQEPRRRQPVLTAQPRRPIYCRPAASSSSAASSQPSSSSNIRASTHISSHRIKNVKDPNEILESGEYDDFKHDIVYILSTLNKKSASNNVKCLSTISLAKKCILPDFRQFIKSEGMAGSVFKALAEAPENEIFALTASTVIYLLSRDFNSIKIDFPALKVISQLLRIEHLGPDSDEKEKMLNMVWDVFCSYLEKQEVGGKKVTFDMKKENLTSSTLILESLVFIATRCANDEGFKTELLNLGILQFIVAKIETMVQQIENGEENAFSIIILDRCFRILEMCSMLHKKNQAFLISHRGSTLINMLAKCLRIFHERVPTLEDHVAKQYMNCLALMARVLINLSHENELCCSKLGQIPEFLPDCLTAFTFLAPKYASDDKKFDINVMMCSLLTNLVERSNVNRKKLIGINIRVTSPSGSVEEMEGLEALTKLFVHHEAQARTIDEDLDRELAFEEGGDDDDDGNGSSSDDEDGARKDGRLNRNKIEDMGEDDMVNAVQQVMNKASAHMEDSILASYIALLVGCLLQQNEEHADDVRNILPNSNFANMISQLQRFHEFMKLATQKKSDSSAGCRAIERIIDLLDRLE